MNMNQPIQADPSPTAARLKAAYLARRAKEAAAARRVQTANQNAPAVKLVAVPKRFMAKKLPLWSFEEVHFDAHVKRWHLHLAEAKAANGAPLKAYIKRRGLDMGIGYAQIVGKSRKKEIVAARQLIMWEIKRQVKPSISWPELGRLFGGKDHTTGIHAVRKLDALHERGMLPARPVADMGAK